MSEPLVTQRDLEGLLRRLRAIEERVGRSEVQERALGRTPTYAQRVLNPFPFASSGLAAGEFPQFGSSARIVVYRLAVFVVTTNTGANFWTITLRDDAGNVLATLATGAISPNVWTRLATTTITQPGSANVVLTVRPTATGTPGAIFVVPEILVVP